MHGSSKPRLHVEDKPEDYLEYFVYILQYTIVIQCTEHHYILFMFVEQHLEKKRQRKVSFMNPYPTPVEGTISSHVS